MMRTASLILLLAMSAPALAAPSSVTVPTGKNVADTYQVVNANVVRCFAEGEYTLNSYAGSEIQPPKIILNGRWGHQFSVIDIAPASTGSVVTVKLVYKLGRGKRGEQWQRALRQWLETGSHEFCPAMP